MASNSRGSLVGIDLGTTYSVIAQLDSQGFVKTISNREGSPRMPSVVYLDGNSAWVGDAAKKIAGTDSSRVAMHVKSDIGNRTYARTVDGRNMRPETLSAIILRKLKQDAEKRIGPISQAVITVPAFFNDTRRKATQDAGRIAGLEVLDIINEPTAAALAYSLEGSDQSIGSRAVREFPQGEMTVLVYDLGGGTFDVTVVRLASKQFETLASDGQVHLGGKDWDDQIVDFVANEFQKRFGFNPLESSDPAEARQRRDSLAAIAESAKILLSDLPRAPILFACKGHELNTSLTRAAFEEMTQPLLMQTQILTDLVIGQKGLVWSGIDRVLMVGGSTRMPMVGQMLEQITGKKPDDSLDPDQVVARGAAIHAGIVASQSDTLPLGLLNEVTEDLKDIDVVNVNAFSLGVDVRRDGKLGFSRLVHKNTQLPAAASRVYRLTQSISGDLPVTIFEGESDDLRHNIKVGTLSMANLGDHLPAGSILQLRVQYAANGRIEVNVLDMNTGRFATAQIRREVGLTEDEIQHEAEFVQNLQIH